MEIKLEYKDQRIISVINYLKQKFGVNAFQIKDFWEGDNCAIGIINNFNQYLIYISTYDLCEDIFNVEVEKITQGSSESEYIIVDELKKMDLQQLGNLITKYFQI